MRRMTRTTNASLLTPRCTPIIHVAPLSDLPPHTNLHQRACREQLPFCPKTTPTNRATFNTPLMKKLRRRIHLPPPRPQRRAIHPHTTNNHQHLSQVQHLNLHPTHRKHLWTSSPWPSNSWPTQFQDLHQLQIKVPSSPGILLHPNLTPHHLLNPLPPPQTSLSPLLFTSLALQPTVLLPKQHLLTHPQHSHLQHCRHLSWTPTHRFFNKHSR